jgi:hypothetical protein
VLRTEWNGERATGRDLRESQGAAIMEHVHHDVRPVVVLDLEDQAIE